MALRAGAAWSITRPGLHDTCMGLLSIGVRLLSGRGFQVMPRAEIEFKFGSGPGIRTLNLAVNRSLRPVQKYGPDLAECR